MRGKEKLSDYKSRKERIFLAIDQDGNCVGETYLGNNDDLVLYEFGVSEKQQGKDNQES